MDSLVTVVVALIGAGGPLTLLMARFDKRNSEQHRQGIEAQHRTLAEVTATRKDLRRVESRLSSDIDRVERRLDSHIDVTPR